MNYETIIGIAAASNLLQRFTYYKVLLTKLNLDRKPFNCVMCSTFWLSIGYNALTTDIVTNIFISSVTAVIAELLDIQLNKL